MPGQTPIEEVQTQHGNQQRADASVRRRKPVQVSYISKLLLSTTPTPGITYYLCTLHVSVFQFFEHSALFATFSSNLCRYF